MTSVICWSPFISNGVYEIFKANWFSQSNTPKVVICFLPKKFMNSESYQETLSIVVNYWNMITTSHLIDFHFWKVKRRYFQLTTKNYYTAQISARNSLAPCLEKTKNNLGKYKMLKWATNKIKQKTSTLQSFKFHFTVAMDTTLLLSLFIQINESNWISILFFLLSVLEPHFKFKNSIYFKRSLWSSASGD